MELSEEVIQLRKQNAELKTKLDNVKAETWMSACLDTKRLLHTATEQWKHYASLYETAEAANAELRELLSDAENAIDALLIFGHQHTAQPLLKEMTVLERIRKPLKTPDQALATQPEATGK